MTRFSSYRFPTEPLTPLDLERAADRVREIGGLRRWQVRSALTVARSVVGAENVRAVPHLPMSARLTWSSEGAGIEYRSSLESVARDFQICHELGHFILAQGHAENAWIEEQCDYIAAAILMPRIPFLDAHATMGDDWPQLAAFFGVTETAAFLRVGELTGRSVAVVSPKSCRVRGEGEWPTADEIRREARAPRPGLASTILDGDPRRFALMVRDGNE